MNDTDRPVIRISNPNDLLGLIPYILGFEPADSLILIGVHHGSIAVSGRLDLPDANAPDPLHDTAAALLTRRLIEAGAGMRVLAVGYGTAEPVEPAITTAVAQLEDAGIPTDVALRVTDGRFWALHEPTWPADGVPFDPSASAAAASAVYAGLVALPSRDSIAESLAPVTGAARDRMTEATGAACTMLLDILGATDDRTDDEVLDTPEWRNVLTAGRNCLASAAEKYRNATAVDDDHAALLTVLLALKPLRDNAIRATTADAWQITMWSDLVRRAEPAFVTNPAVLLTLCALQSGNGVLANVAVDRAVRSNPDDRFAGLLAHAVVAGIDPQTVKAFVTK
ncbi:hypothetical protein Val02_62660 [Virgisporangium aliadipatigenens]|uniref:DUF4192 domain-containing protein n=1 Tax=Virgisporangium aliadipatigenens TaxID=741659 RepID=A0A8J3YSZ6_9ACTN|nr:DUF4192 domain-containing protein [Virgisporangium aliadipatigenens]GIJ49380.1 hypothetical protein Val02_62660 [Virgisporangium aliadipatigenens]